MRYSGILLHISSLPSPYGIGTLGKAAYDFADFLHAAGQHYWQILPIGPTSYGDSPYQSFSTHAGNPYFIDLDILVQDGLLLREELDGIDWEAHSDRVDYGFQFDVRFDLLYRAYRRGWDSDEDAIREFREAQPWVEEYALYMALKRRNGMRPWNTWPEEIRLRHTGAVETYATVLAEDTNFFLYLQFLFFRQWNALRDYVHGLGIEIIGDLPIYVPYDSCDVWANPSLFQLDKDGTPTALAGCPPDSFTPDGQLWGNPLYDWEKMQRDGYAWWLERIRAVSELFDVIRLDHFRGLESYWSIPYGAETAKNGQWLKGPGEDFIRTLHRVFPSLQMIAEDLGYLTPEVMQLQADSGFPGMKVLEFAFDPREPSNYLPHRYPQKCICYTGTHDNETLTQWFENAPEEIAAFACEYLDISEPEKCCSAILRAGMRSVADTFIAQMQDYLSLGGEARMNVPGTVSTRNWSWRLAPDALKPELAEKIRRMTRLYER